MDDVESTIKIPYFCSERPFLIRSVMIYKKDTVFLLRFFVICVLVGYRNKYIRFEGKTVILSCFVEFSGKPSVLMRNNGGIEKLELEKRDSQEREIFRWFSWGRYLVIGKH